MHDVVHGRPFDRHRLFVENFAPIQSILFRRSAYEECGGFHGDLDWLENWNLWCRYSSLGDFTYVEKIASLYRVSADPGANATR